MNEKRRINVSDQDAYFNELDRERHPGMAIDDAKKLYGVVHVGWLLLGQLVAMVLVLVKAGNAEDALVNAFGSWWWVCLVEIAFWILVQLLLVGMLFYINELAGKLSRARTDVQHLREALEGINNRIHAS